MTNKAKFKVGDRVVRVKYKDGFDYYHKCNCLIVTSVLENGKVIELNGGDTGQWDAENFERVEPEVKPTEQPGQFSIAGKPNIDRKLRLTEMQKEAIQAGINALYRHEEFLKEQSYDPSLTYCIEICKYQQEVLRSMLREVNR